MKKITVFNNLTKQKEILEPLDPATINIYTCGPTVYDDSHIGHARSALTWDVITRFLRYAGYKVNWARNITDIDDKILKKSIELGINPSKVARIYTYSFYEDMIRLGIDWPDYEPQATQYLPQMYSFIESLIKNKHAYTINNDVYFSVSSFKEYGKLKGQNIQELEKGFGRIEPNEKKKNKLDFALWKGVKSNDEYGFDSPWGKGRPGWHLECSTMNYSLFGPTLDIHGGGDDLIFPHHENEIAQSESLTGKPFAKYWLHNGMILVNEEKMAKSLGNFITIKEALKNITPNALRFFVLNTHYRMPLNYTSEALVAAQNGINRLQEALSDLSDNNLPESSTGNFEKEFTDAMCNDFNTPIALSILFNITDKINTEKNPKQKKAYQKELLNLSQTLGLNLINTQAEYATLKDKSFSSIIEMLINWRIECKNNKDYKSADKIRDILSKCNIEVKDLTDNKYKWQFKA